MITLRPIQYCDLALKSKNDPGVKILPDGSVQADWFVLVTACRVGALVYLLDLYRAQIPFPEQVKVLARERLAWKSWKIGIENNAYQWALGQAAWEKGLPCVPVNQPGDKVFKWQLATPHFETGRVRIRGIKEPNGYLAPYSAFRRFIKEALDAPYGDYDDCIDAVCGAVLMCTSEEFVSQQPSASVTKGFAVALSGGRGQRYRTGDRFDIFPSNY